jgi:putative oxygen-independent coproporphyrinogen III oxidase
MLELPPLSLYVHIPYCVRKCPYCDFNSHQSNDEIPEQAYVEALIKDLNNDLPWVQGRKLHSVFFGGGTPSLFSAKAIETIIDSAHQLIGFEEAIEITLEANPGTFEQQKFANYRTAGVNRLSIGVQSFNNKHLSTLGRIHDGKQALAAIEMALAADFERLNIDLMHGLPDQTSNQALADLDTAINTGTSHISWYQLTIEPNTEFFSKPPTLPIEDELAEIQQTGQQKLYQAGFRQYEVSAFSRHGAVCDHNINYWQFGDYLGIGAGAHGKATLVDQGQIVRTTKTRQPANYLATAETAKASDKIIANNELPLEFMMNALRLRAGVNNDLFTARTGLDRQVIQPTITQLQSQGLLKDDPATDCASDLGYRFLNTVLQSFS